MSNLRTEAKQNIFKLIIAHIFQCCDKMRSECETSEEYLYNHEDKISNRLVERYLDLNVLGLRFVRETPQHYDDETDTYKGRADITVKSSDWLQNRKAYYVIECKRLDGEIDLNNKYVSEGISRFVISPVPKYSSYYGRNIMLGYVVRDIKIADNTMKIDCIQRKFFDGIKIGKMELVCDGGCFSHYTCSYQSIDAPTIELAHLFYDFSSVVDIAEQE